MENIFTKLFQKRSFPTERKSYVEGGFLLVGSTSLESNPTVQACISKIANTISELPLTLYVKRKGGGRTPAYFNTLYDVVKNPSIRETPTLFYSTLIRHLLTHGNAYIYLTRIGQNIVGFSLVDPTKVKVNVDVHNRKYFTISGVEYTEKEILHIPYPLGYDGLTGKSPINVYSELIQLDNELIKYSRAYFTNSVGSRAVLKMTGKYAGMKSADEAYANLIPYLNKFVTGASNAGKMMITPPDTELGSITLPSNQESELIAMKNNIEKMIAYGFNVPWSLISEENKYNSREQQQLNFLQETIQPLGKHISQSIDTLLNESDKKTMYFTFNYKVLLETDTKSTVEYISKEIFSGLMSVNEGREKLDMDSIGEAGDSHFIPSAYYPLTMDNINAFFAKSKLALEQGSGLTAGDENTNQSSVTE